MLARISALPKNYDWGSTTAIPGVLGTLSDGRPQAELWLGAHPDSTTSLVDPAPGLPVSLNEWIAVDPASALGGEERLPFLLKLLAAEKPLSLQAHPTIERARAGFAEENARGVPRDAPSRNYRDEWHKPELMVALHDGFEALCGFRPMDQTLAFLDRLADAAPDASRGVVAGYRAQLSDDGLRATVGSVLAGDSARLVAGLVDAAHSIIDSGPESSWQGEARLLVHLDGHYPGDRGIAVAALLNYAVLDEGQALYLPAGNVHAYVKGLGVEIMAASDNVLRGGLTSKSVDVPELMAVLDFSTMPPPLIEATPQSNGYAEYTTPLPDFRLIRVDAGTEATIPMPKSAIALAVVGGASVSDGIGRVELAQGESVFVTPSDSVTVRSHGTSFVATSR